MSGLRKPTLGPIVGHTTHKSCRLWISASEKGEMDDEENRRTVGVIGVVSGGKVKPENVYYFRLHREYCRTGTFNLGEDVTLWATESSRQKLKPFSIKADTRYEVRLGTLTVDDPFENEEILESDHLVNKLPEPGIWAAELSNPNGNWLRASFKTYKKPPADGKAKDSISFLLGSCRYPGILWKKKHADRIFGPMINNHSDVDFALMVGDQIYADKFNRMIPVGNADTFEEFEERYHTAFSSPNMRRLLSSLPTYMILDDHEIEDNWAQDRIKDSKKRLLFNLAIGAYMDHQWCHGPRFNDSYVHNLELKGKDKHLQRMDGVRLFYDFACSGYPFFVLDGRTQRYRDDNEDLGDNHLLGKPALHDSEPNQLTRVCKWLQHMQDEYGNVPKFIVTAGVFVPNGVSTIKGDKYKDNDDSWPAFPSTRRALLKCIVDNGVQNVIFLSGDIHCANIAEIDFTGVGDGANPYPGADLKAYSITSSAFYWPFPFADGEPSHYVHDSRSSQTPDTFKIGETEGVMDYEAWSFTQEDNFCRIDVTSPKNELKVSFYGSKGEALNTRKRNDKVNTKPEVLKLAPW